MQVEGGRWTSFLKDPTRGVPDARLVGRIKGLRLPFAGKNETVADCLQKTGVLWERFWEPMAVAVLNTPPKRASAQLLWKAMRESFARGQTACRPLVAKESLAASLVDPGLAFLTRHHADLYFGQRLRLLDLSRRAEALHFASLQVTLEPGDHVILALPPSLIADLLPDVPAPTAAHAILNAHFRLSAPVRQPDRSKLLGLIGGRAQWLFFRDDIVSVTVSAADRLVEETAETIANVLWLDVAKAMDLPTDPIPPFRVIKESARPFRKPRPPTSNVRRRGHAGPTFTSPGTGPTRACRRPSRGLSVPDTSPLEPCSTT